MAEITVFFTVGGVRSWIDEPDRLFIVNQQADGHLRILEKRRVVPGGRDNFLTPKTLHIYPPGTWSEVELDYGS